ncbi:unnamed protein product [Blepharisma stoltei]|uniref:Cyclic nucleotide-binding domain-containing protein n=1 Tax=Blepharisma stoltei TaxID=1481888 RepID=A0AAU9IDH8_9CILI|nr:unnamed protein product [Blepharisma stoltei]
MENSGLKRSNWTNIQKDLSQGPIEDPKNAANKSLHHLRTIKKDSFLPSAPVSKDGKSRLWILSPIQPESSWKLLWDITTMIFIVYYAITVPYRICFNVPIAGWWKYLEFFITLCFMADIFVCFNTGFYAKGSLQMNRKEIIKHYLKTWFLFDLIASIPLTWFITGPFEDGDSSDSGQVSLSNSNQFLRLVKVFRFLRILRLVRMAKLKRMLIKIEDYIASNAIATIFMFLRLLSIVFFIAHWTACWWYFLGDLDMMYYPTTWVTVAKIENSSPFDKYITSLYWAFTTMTTVGYGDIVPKTLPEKIYAMFAMIVACGVFAYTVGSIGSLVSKQNAVENAYREQVVAVNRYMRKKDLPHDLQFRVRRYLEYVWENKKKSNLDEKQILTLLSEPLRDEIYAHIHGIVIKLCPIFEQYEAHFISQLTRALESETYAPGDTVIEEGEMSTKMYFIQNGKIDIFHHSTKSTYKDLGPKEYFGEIAFFTEKPRCASAKCLDFVDLLSLSRANMNQLLEKFPEAKEQTDLLSKKCEDNDFSTLLVKCYICKELGHVAIKCKKILLNLDKEETKKKWLEKRSAPETKRLTAEDSFEPNYHRVPKMKLINRNYDSRNVRGISKPIAKLFSNDPHIYPKIEGFIEKYGQGQSYSSSIVSATNSQLEMPASELPVRKADPKFTMIYMDSEDSDKVEDDISPGYETKPARKKKFRMSLLDRLSTYGGEQQQAEKNKSGKLVLERSYSMIEERAEPDSEAFVIQPQAINPDISEDVKEEQKAESSVNTEIYLPNLEPLEGNFFKSSPSPNSDSEFGESEEPRDL